ncbi:MAG: hypothetical protein SFW67_24325 [Myxococcaceae bacterium]|nr:hypothetical protein [Myxococcaceae bacterium]
MTRLLFVCALAAAPALADFKRLHAERATASSFLESNWNKYQENYHPTYVLDDDPKTAWVEGAEGDGVGEALTIPLSALKAARTVKLVITPGYQKSKPLFAANGTPTALSVAVRDLSGTQTGAAELTLKPAWGQQTFEVPVKGGLASVTLTVKAVRAGATYRDTCLSDVQVFVDSDTPYDSRVEEARRQAMARWKAERLAAAKYFASLPKSYPFASARYRAQTVVESRRVQKRWKRLVTAADGSVTGEPDPAFRDVSALIGTKSLPSPMDEGDAALLSAVESASKATSGKWFAASTKRVTQPPDGLAQAFPGFALPFLDAADVTLFESKATSATIPRLRVEEGLTAEKRSDLLLLEGTSAAPRFAVFKHVKQVSDRVEYQESTWVLLRWTEAGHLDRVATLMQVLDADGSGPPPTIIVQVWHVTRDGPIEVRELRSWNGANSDFAEAGDDDGTSLEVVRYVPVTK